MGFDIEGARKAGYSESEIVDHLAQQSKFDAGQARKAGYSDAEILSHFATELPQQENAPADVVTSGGHSHGRATPVDEQPGPDLLHRAVGAYNQFSKNLGGGLVRGAGSIGSTLMWPVDKAQDLYYGDRDPGLTSLVTGEKPLSRNEERRAGIDSGLQQLGADPNSLTYKGGKLAGEIAGTAGAGGVLAKGAQAVGAAPKIVSALSTGGFNLGSPAATTVGGRMADAALRATAGAVTGGAQAGLVDPSQAEAGAVVGGALPGATQLAGKAGAAVKNAIGTLATNTFGATTGAGSEAVRTAFEAGKQGSREFLDNMRGNTPFEDVVDSARNALVKMKMQRSAAYKSGMADVSNDKSVLDFAPVDDALNRISGAGKYKGISIRQKAGDTADELKSIVDEWRQLDPAEYHTPEGFDALKQAIGDIRDSTQFGTNSRRIADDLYNAVKGQITQQSPGYAKVMKDYQEASDTLKELERTFSLGDKAKVSRDTALRKFQSLMRNNAQTNYGNRLDAAKKLQAGGEDVLPAVAGQSMGSWTPRGMVGAVEKGAIGLGSLLQPQLLAAAPFASPRVVGEASYKLGQLAGGAQRGGSIISSFAPSQQRIVAVNDVLRAAPVVTLSDLVAPR